MVVKRSWTWLLWEYMTFANSEMRSCKPSIKVIILSTWGIDDQGWEWVLEGWGSRLWGEDVSRSLETLGATEIFPMGEAWEDNPLLGGLEGLFFALSTEEWTLLLWSEYKEIGPWQDKTIPSLGRWMPLRVMIFMMRLQKGRQVLAVGRPAILPKNLKDVSTNVDLSSINEIT